VLKFVNILTAGISEVTYITQNSLPSTLYSTIQLCPETFSTTLTGISQFFSVSTIECRTEPSNRWPLPIHSFQVHPTRTSSITIRH